MRHIVFLSHIDMNLYLFRRPIMRKLVAVGWRVTAVVPEGEYSSQFAVDGIEHVSYQIDRRGMYSLQEVKVIFRLWRILRNLKPDVVHSFTMKPNIYGTIAARLARVPVIVNSVTGLGSYFLDGETAGRTRKVLLGLYRLAGFLNTKSIFQNRDDLSFFLQQNLILDCKTSLIKGSGVDLERFKPERFSQEQKDQLRAEINIPAGHLVVTCISRLLKDKGVGEFCDAAKLLKKKWRGKVTFLLVGDYYDGNPSTLSRDYIDELVKDEIIRFVGWRHDIPELLSISDVVTLPSYREGLPVSLQEALAMGKPVVTTDAPGCRETVDDDVNGFLVEVRNADAVAQAVEQLLHDEGLREQMGFASLEKAKAEFDVRRITDQNVALYQKLLKGVPFRRLPLCSKRFFDLLVIIFFLPLLLPVLLLLTFLVRIRLGSPILFRQVRPGIYGRPFRIYKFRTMTDNRDARGELLPDAERLTGFGKFLRSTSLDELPELINVLFGDMSLVGPRPLLMEYLDRYNEQQYRRHEVLPGITGWAQINGRNAISWDEKFAYDLWYVDNRSILLDLKILWMTVLKVFKREGVSQEGQATAEKFMGSKDRQG